MDPPRKSLTPSHHLTNQSTKGGKQAVPFAAFGSTRNHTRVEKGIHVCVFFGLEEAGLAPQAVVMVQDLDA